MNLPLSHYLTTHLTQSAITQNTLLFPEGESSFWQIFTGNWKGQSWIMERMKQYFLFQGILWLSGYWWSCWSWLSLGSFSLIFLSWVTCEFLTAKSPENLEVEIYLPLLLWFGLNCFVWKSKIKWNKNYTKGQGVTAVMLDILKKIPFINLEVFIGSRFTIKTNRKAH